MNGITPALSLENMVNSIFKVAKSNLICAFLVVLIFLTQFLPPALKLVDGVPNPFKVRHKKLVYLFHAPPYLEHGQYKLKYQNFFIKKPGAIKLPTWAEYWSN